MLTLKKISGYIFFVLLIVVSVLTIFNNLTTIPDIQKLKFGEEKTYVISIFVIEMILDCVLLVCGVIGISKVNSNNFNLCTYAILPLTFISAFTNLALDFTHSYLKKLFEIYYSSIKTVPGYIIIQIVLTVVTFFVLLIALGIKIDEHPEGKKGFAIAGAILLLVNLIVGMVNTVESTTMQTVINILQIVIFVIFVPLVISSDTFSSIRKSSVYVKRVVTPINEEPKRSVEPAKQLAELRKLFENGLITEEEYNQKRKKYIDML